MKKIIILTLLLSIAACKKSNGLGGEKKPDFKLTAFSEVSDGKNKTRRFELLQHALYSKIINQNSFTETQTKELISLNTYSNAKYEKDFAKLIVISNDEEKVFYVPVNYSKKFLAENLDYYARNEELKFWLGSELKVGEVSYLLLTTPDMLLKNEIKFLSKTDKKMVVSEFRLENISRYQKVELKIKGLESNPVIKTFSDSKKMISGRCDPEAMQMCICDYNYSAPTNDYSGYNEFSISDIPLKLSINNNQVESLVESYSFSFYNQEDMNSLILSFEEYKDSNYVSGIQALSNACKADYKVSNNYRKKFRYEVEMIVKGTSIKYEEMEKLMSNAVLK